MHLLNLFCATSVPGLHRVNECIELVLSSAQHYSAHCVLVFQLESQNHRIVGVGRGPLWVI